jgi:hypothetical protein
VPLAASRQPCRLHPAGPALIATLMRIIPGVAVNWQHRGDLLYHRMTCVRDIASPPGPPCTLRSPDGRPEAGCRPCGLQHRGPALACPEAVPRAGTSWPGDPFGTVPLDSVA